MAIGTTVSSTLLSPAPNLGVYGSIMKVLMASPLSLIANGRVWFDERPEQVEFYPCCVLVPARTLPEYTFETWKEVEYPFTIEMYSFNLSDVTTMAWNVEQVLDTPNTIHEIATDTGVTDSGITLDDRGALYGREKRKFTKDARRPHYCFYNWSCLVRRQTSLARGERE